MSFYFIAGFLQVGLLWITTGVSLLWLCRRIDESAAVRLLSPVVILLAACSLAVAFALGMEAFVASYSGAMYEMEAMRYRLTGPYSWVYRIQLVAGALPAAFLVHALRRSMPWITALSLFAFSVAHIGNFTAMLTGSVPIP